MKTKSQANQEPSEPSLFRRKFERPDFAALLKKPLLDVPLPDDFKVDEEKEHLEQLWESAFSLGNYEYKDFVHAGGSGMVFRVQDENLNVWAMKIVRKRIYGLQDTTGEVATALSPVSESELRALQKLSHPNVVRLREAIEDTKGVVAICTTYVEKPLGLDRYLQSTLAKHPDPTGKKGIHPFSPQRLDDACAFLAKRFAEIVSAVRHMHGQRMYHFDIKPANILISGVTQQAVLTDMGSCIHADALTSGAQIRVHFTWTYAHPDLTTIISHPQSISGGGLKASARVDAKNDLAKFDLFALGKTLQEALAIIEREFRARCHASFGFRFLHVIACLLLDGRNTPARNDAERRKQIVEKDGRRFADDIALEYPPELFEAQKIQTMEELVERMDRFTRQYSWNHIAPELDHWQPDLINAVVNSPAPFTVRVAKVFNHPAMHRLKQALHLGWLKEVYPGATHDRWAHSLGVFSGLVSYYNALLSDPAVPTFRVLVNKDDMEHAFLAAILHDLGQTTFGHDFEEACPFLFRHENLISRILQDEFFGTPTLEQTIVKHWPSVSIPRVLAILRNRWSAEPPDANLRATDGIASDALNGPIDADKFDYLLRDSVTCGVAYGHGLDPSRFLQALTVSTVSAGVGRCRLALAYKAKGRPAVESLLLARYQMYGAVYWHHTFRCIRAMFTHAGAKCFDNLEKNAKSIRGISFTLDQVQELLYERVLCVKRWEDCRPTGTALSRRFFSNAPAAVAAEPALDLLWQFAEPSERALVERLARRDLYKRIFEMRVGELGQLTNYAALRSELSPSERVRMAGALQKRLLDQVVNDMRERGPVKSVSENAARARLDELKASNTPQIVIDFPTRGLPSERNLPKEIGDPERKYFTLPARGAGDDDNVFHAVRGLQERMAMVRVFASPELHELVVRYVQPLEIQQCVESVIDKLRRG